MSQESLASLKSFVLGVASVILGNEDPEMKHEKVHDDDCVSCASGNSEGRHLHELLLRLQNLLEGRRRVLPFSLVRVVCLSAKPNKCVCAYCHGGGGGEGAIPSTDRVCSILLQGREDMVLHCSMTCLSAIGKGFSNTMWAKAWWCRGQ